MKKILNNNMIQFTTLLLGFSKSRKEDIFYKFLENEYKNKKVQEDRRL